MGPLAWEAFAHRHEDAPSGIKRHEGRSAILALLADENSSKTCGESAARKMFKIAVDGEDSELMLALLDARLRPGADWKISRGGHSYYDAQNGVPRLVGLGLACAMAKGADLFGLVKSCAPAIAAAKRAKEHPALLAKCQIARLMELFDLGVPIDGLDSSGRSLSHLWAETDYDPRDGWATLARKAPEVYGMRDRQGRLGQDLMSEKLAGRRGGEQLKDAFLSSLAKIEQREIKREVGKPKSPRAALGAKRL
jgi:hypothetical protein